MYFLEKLCRICVRTEGPLVDINTVDFDLVKLSEKLEICANLAISKDPISSEICEKCANKLRVSYHFLDMCKNSTNIIQGYFAKLTHKNEETAENNESHLTVEIDKLDYDDLKIRRKQRISKEQRCSLLKQLLSKPKKERDKFIDEDYDYHKGGLKNIIDFTTNYEFSFKLDKNSNIESSPLDKLKAFSTNYFQRDFTEFNDKILYVIENRNSIQCDSNFGSDDDDYLTEFEDDKESIFEEVLVEPDIQIKNELIDDEESRCPLDFLETSIEEDDSETVKREPLSDSDEDDLNIKDESDENLKHSSVSTFNFKRASSIESSPSVKLLDRLVSNYPLTSRKIFSSSNVRCRTRDQPYINPLLKNQFLYRSFKCERCNRYFKSQGYLKAHTSKVH